MTWPVVAAVAAVCFALRVAAPLLLRSRPLPAALERRLDAAIGPLLAALFAVQLFTARGSWSVDARAAGALAAGIVFLYRRSLPLALAAAAAVTAGLRFF